MLQLVVNRKAEARKRKAKMAKNRRAPNAVTVAVREFAAELGLDFFALDDAARGAVFEQFAAFHILRRFHEQELTPAGLAPLIVADEADERLDCVAMMVDGRLVTDEAALDAALEEAGDAPGVVFAIIQATRANRFDPIRLSRFTDGAHAFFADAEDAALSVQKALKERLFAKAREMGVTPVVSIYGYFAALGSWETGSEDDAARKTVFARARAALEGLPEISEAEFEPVDKFRILDFMATGLPLRELPEATAFEVEPYEAVLPAAGLIALPRIDGVDGGYFGHVPITAFLSLLERDDGQGLREAIFHQNVRGYQGDGGVNARIRETLASKQRAQFLLRNNGVTVVADAIEPSGGSVSLRNYQIVNGLQTSTVLFRMRDDLRHARDVHVPVKLVAATDTPVRRAIIDATNRQTPITGASLFAACDKARTLEEYFLNRIRSGGPKIVLERRPGQYDRSVPAERITLEEALRGFYAVFREQPHIAERGFSAIAAEVDDGLLAPSLTAEPYYVAARLIAWVRALARAKDEPRLAQVELHAAYGLRVLCAPDDPPMGDAAAMRAYCREIELRINNPALATQLETFALDITQSPRDRMRNRVQGVPQLRRTRDDVARRAREAAKTVVLDVNAPSI